MNTPNPTLPPQEAEPVKTRAGWMPTTSTYVGGVAGGALAQLCIAAVETLVLHGAEMKSATAGALTTLCVVAAGYLFPDGGRK